VIKRPAPLAAALMAALFACQPADSDTQKAKALPPVTSAKFAALPEGVLVLKRATITDTGVIAKGAAMTLLVPDGWQTRGGIETKPNMCSEIFGVNWTATAPDGKSSLFIFPTEGWAASNTGIASDCMAASFQSTGDYLAARIAYMYPRAKITKYTPRDDYSKAAQGYARDTQTMAQQYGFDMQVWADGGEMTFTYTQNGAAMEGMLAASSLFFVSSNYNPMGGPPLQALNGGTLGTFGATAPAGALNLQLAEAVRRSVTPNADWLQALMRISAQINRTAVQGTEQRAAMIVAGGAAATKSNIEAYRNMTAATAANGMPDPIKTGSGGTVSYTNESTNDRIQRESIEAVRGVETYYDSVGEQTVQLDATYDNAWRVTNNDTYILTNDPNFNPGAYDIQATQMKVLK